MKFEVVKTKPIVPFPDPLATPQTIKVYRGRKKWLDGSYEPGIYFCAYGHAFKVNEETGRAVHYGQIEYSGINEDDTNQPIYRIGTLGGYLFDEEASGVTVTF